PVPVPSRVPGVQIRTLTPEPHDMPEIARNLRQLATRWTGARAAERANAQLYLVELCDSLQVERPRPAGAGDSEYQFEFGIRVVNRDGSETPNFVDLYRKGHFVLEAKDEVYGRSTDL